VRVKEPSVCIILPALNEEPTIAKVIDEIPSRALREQGYRVSVVVVDSGSSDRTAQIAREKGANVIFEPRRGKGRAVRTALKAVKANYVFMLDADYTYPATYILDMLKLLRGGSPVVVGSRLKGKMEKGAMSRLNLVGNYLLSLMASILYRTVVTDLCTGYWGLQGEVIPSLKLSADGFQLEAELFTQLAKRGYHIAQLPIYYRRRPTPPKLSSLKDGIRIGWTLITNRLERRAD
jgi:glycosyltransferase involved in cell wall biosynthesis